MNPELEDYIGDLRPTLAGYLILKKLFPRHSTIVTPYPTAELSELELEQLKDALNECMPADSLIMDIRNWDCHFEDDLDDDWYWEAVFGRQSSIAEPAERLVDYFFEKVEEYHLDYDFDGTPETIRAHMFDIVRKFIMDWRHSIEARVAKAKTASPGCPSDSMAP